MSSKRRSRHDRRSRSSSSGSSRSRSHSQSSEEAEGVRLHVADLEGMGVSKHELQYVFDKYGPLKEIWVAKSPPCFAFVVFRDREDAEDALRATDGIFVGLKEHRKGIFSNLPMGNVKRECKQMFLEDVSTVYLVSSLCGWVGSSAGSSTCGGEFTTPANRMLLASL
uniref:RRM domain-containing protein n=1 Tax=Timema cristinae TaxID=61476 RepID=A0A7R9CXT6_TIMCR|nr:unnamed protein product [Timema cristinae]